MPLWIAVYGLTDERITYEPEPIFQYLRAERHMTQEQLAMLLGVSRQSVTKWEAGRAYPEMDKLMKMCQVFECTLDNLVNGDMSRKPGVRVDLSSGLLEVKAEPSLVYGETGSVVASISSVPTVPVGSAVDVCGYDEHMVAFCPQGFGRGLAHYPWRCRCRFYGSGDAPLE